MIKFEVTVDSAILDYLSTMGIGKAMPGANAAFNKAAGLIQSQWQGWAMGGDLEGIDKIKSPSGKLAQSIKVKRNAPFDVDIYSDSTQAQRIQDGENELDMKETHPYGNKSRVSKKGIPYLIIPFRWGTPNSKGGARAHFKNVIPQPMYSAVMAFKMETSRRLEKRADGSKATHIEKNYRGAPIERAEYQWGGRIKADGNIDGLVRMADDTGKSKGSTFFTFRVISATKSPKGSWIRPAVAPVDVVSALEKTTRPAVEQMILEGFRADVGV